MNSLDLASIVNKSMGEMMSTYSMQLVRVDDNEILLRSTLYTLDVFADKDGVSLVYFDTTKSPVVGYNVFLFLLNKRRDLLELKKNKPLTSSYVDFVTDEINGLARHLNDAGRDVLDGSKEWIKDYSWPAVRPSREVFEAMQKSDS